MGKQKSNSEELLAATRKNVKHLLSSGLSSDDALAVSALSMTMLSELSGKSSVKLPDGTTIIVKAAHQGVINE